jgi:hypothetical protein
MAHAVEIAGVQQREPAVQGRRIVAMLSASSAGP